jgi:ADP-ribosylglycohydrolase
MSLLGAFRGCLLGGALGDALGYPIEFQHTPEIARRFPATPASLRLDGGPVARVSDDTQMTLFTAEGLIRAWQRGTTKGICHPPTVVAFALLRWYETQGHRVAGVASEPGWLIADRRLHALRAPGNTCLSALRALARSGDVGASLGTVDRPPNDSKGCGAVMRVAPCGLAAATREEAFALARDTGVITHGHPSGYLSGAYLAALVWDLARGGSLDAALDAADALLAGERGRGELVDVLARARALAARGAPDARTIEALGGGWTGEEALAIALLCTLTFDRGEPRALEQALWRAAAHSGDSDSTAAITGNLLGAMLGVDALPAGWLDELELRDVIDRIATDLHASWIAGEALADYPPE